MPFVRGKETTPTLIESKGDHSQEAIEMPVTANRAPHCTGPGLSFLYFVVEKFLETKKLLKGTLTVKLHHIQKRISN